MSTEAQRQEYRERQARVSERRKAEGQMRLAIWIPGDVHAYCVREANRRGISLREYVIRQLRKS